MVPIDFDALPFIIGKSSLHIARIDADMAIGARHFVVTNFSHWAIKEVICPYDLILCHETAQIIRYIFCFFSSRFACKNQTTFHVYIILSGKNKHAENEFGVYS